jgi:hypothetical protein
VSAETVALVLIFAGGVLAAVDEAIAQGKSLLGWAVILIAAGLLWTKVA